MPDDIVIKALKTSFFDLVLKENFPHTPQITLKLDNLTAAIRQLETNPPGPASTEIICNPA